MITTWYLQSQRTWDKLCHSCIGSSFLPRGAFPEGRAYAFPQRLHAGSLEALGVSRPEGVVLAVNNLQTMLGRVAAHPRHQDRDDAVGAPVQHAGDGAPRTLDRIVGVQPCQPIEP